MFVIKDYGKKPVFSSFLPGIAGQFGIPAWCFYVNRGQGVASFGTCDKDHAILEFAPAQEAYRRVETHRRELKQEAQVKLLYGTHHSG